MALSPDFYVPFNSTNDLLGASSRARVGGSSFTVFTWQNKPISFLRQMNIQTAAPVAAVSPIHPLDEPYPVELVTPQAATMGVLTLEMYELYGQLVWERLVGLANKKGSTVDIANVFAAVANSPTPIHVYRIIRPPRIRGKVMPSYTEEFHNVVVASVDDGETIEIGTMEILKTVVLNYTHVTRGGYNGLLTAAAQGRNPSSVNFS